MERWVKATSQRKVAKAIGLSPTTICQILNNRYPGDVEGVGQRIKALLTGKEIPDEFLQGDTPKEFKLEKRVFMETTRTPEGQVQGALFKREVGQIEVPCLAGRVDFLTATEVVEIKNWKGWKEAIKVLIYQAYFPGRKPRVHLFDNRYLTHETRELIEEHYEALGIRLTWEDRFEEP